MFEVVDFYAEWCGPCLMMKQVLPAIEEELKGKATFRKVNIDENQEEAGKYGVMSIPTFVLLKDDKEIDRRVGFVAKDDFVAWVNSQVS